MTATERQRKRRARVAAETLAEQMNTRSPMSEVESQIEREETSLLHRLLTEGEGARVDGSREETA
jgi:hypothetical protein